MSSSQTSRDLPNPPSLGEPVSSTSRVDRAGAERAVRLLLQAVGQDTDSQRFARIPAELASGLENLLNGPPPEVVVRRNRTDPNELTIHTVRFLSLCPHLSPSMGVAHVGYLPETGRILGEDLEQIVAYLARQPQLPSELAGRIADWVSNQLRPKGCAVLIEAQSSCLAGCAGAAHQAHETALATRGVLRDDHPLRRDFLTCCRAK